MKKILSMLLVMVLIFVLLSGCNKSYGFGNYEYKYCHVCDFSGNCKDFEIKKWYESESGIEIRTVDGYDLWLSEGTYILLNDICPLCN